MMYRCNAEFLGCNAREVEDFDWASVGLDVVTAYRPHQCERLFDGADGLPHPEHRSHYQGRHDVHRLLRRAELHCRPFDLHYRASTGLSKVGVPGSPVGLQDRDITIAQALKPLGYATGQFGKNHLGDLNRYLPTVHGFDEFFGNLYHLNAEEEPEDFNYPTDPKFKEQFGPRGVLRSKASDTDDPTEQLRWGRVGKQTIEDTGPLTRKRMETIDDETSDAAVDFIKRQVTASKPFFCWFNATRMHLRTHVRPDHRDKPGLTARTEYADGMIEHDGHVGKLMKALDDLGIADNTILLYTTDNGPHMNTWPDGAMTPFRNEKNTNWEGAFRVPCMIRWPGHIAGGQVSNEIVSGLDWFPTLLAAAGEPSVKEKLLTGYDSMGQTFKVHLDGYNQLPYLSDHESKSARDSFIYFNDDGDLCCLRYANWKLVFEEQRQPGTLLIWANPFTKLRFAKMYDLHADPYERADTIMPSSPMADRPTSLSSLRHSRSFRPASGQQLSPLTR